MPGKKVTVLSHPPASSEKTTEASENATPVNSKQKMMECDYDTHPTDVYQAIEAKQWDFLKDFFQSDQVLSPKLSPKIPPSQQAATWVVRKEKNGKLRWRLLPIHAALIFQAPCEIVQLLLDAYPPGASAKDDQGMLPLHLALRNAPLNFEILEELLAANPGAVFVKDRKGRTPMASGAVSKKPEGRATLSAFNLYTNIIMAGEKKRITAEHEELLAERLLAQQAQHQVELEQLRRQFEEEQKVMQKNVASERQSWQESLEMTRNDLTEERNRNKILMDQLGADPDGLDERELELRTENQQLKILCQRLLDQQQGLTSSLQDIWVNQQHAMDQRNQLLQEYAAMGEEAEHATQVAVAQWHQKMASAQKGMAESLNRIVGNNDETANSEAAAVESRNESYYTSDGNAEMLLDRVSLSRSGDRNSTDGVVHP